MSRHGVLRASDADRDQIVDRLHRAATEGRIAAEELEHRVNAALRARTYSELDATVADLPGPSPVSRRRTGAERQRSAGSWTFAVVRSHPALLLLAIPAIAVTMAMLIAATVVWAVLMVVVLVVGGRHHGPPPPWAYGRAMRRYRGSIRSARSVAGGRDLRRGRGAYGRGAGRRWA